MRINKKVHLINRFEIGGVEVGVLNLIKSNQIEDYFVIAIKGKDKLFYDSLSQNEKDRVIICNSIFSAVWRLFYLKPDIVITSLWRSHIAGILYKFIRRKSKRVHFIHSEYFAHFLDLLVTKISLKSSDFVFADSNKSLQLLKDKQKVSFVVPMNICFSNKTRSFKAQELSFVYFGRFSEEKRIQDSLHFVRELKAKGLNVSLELYGRDDGCKKELIEMTNKLGMSEYVAFHQPLLPHLVEDCLRKYNYYLQTSKFEGMSISVFQSIKCGLLPVVVPVGEIINYTRHGYNAYYIDCDNLGLVASSFINDYCFSQFSEYSVGKLVSGQSYPQFDKSFASAIDNCVNKF